MVLKLKEDIKPFAKKDDLLFIKENPESIKTDDLVLWPEICPISIYWFSKAKLADYIPFNILKVTKTFHKDGCRYIMSGDGYEIPLEYLTGKVSKIIPKDSPLYNELKL